MMVTFKRDGHFADPASATNKAVEWDCKVGETREVTDSLGAYVMEIGAAVVAQSGAEVGLPAGPTPKAEGPATKKAAKAAKPKTKD